MLKEWIDGKWVERESLLAALGLVEGSFASGRKPEKNCVVSIVGAGGKTTCLRRLQLECKKLGISAATGTTTHIQYERNESFLDRPDMDAAREILKKTGTLWMGEPVSDWKCKALPDLFYRELLVDGIWLLLEADGAREKPVKAPREGEPVLLPETGLVLCVYGLDAVGQPIKEVCCRVEQVCAILEKQETARLTAADLAKLAISLQGGRKGVQPGMRYVVLFNKADTPEREAAAWEAARQIRTLEKKLINAKHFKETFKRNPMGEVEKSLAKKQFSDREMREKSGSAEWGESVIFTASHLMPPWNPQITGEAK